MTSMPHENREYYYFIARKENYILSLLWRSNNVPNQANNIFACVLRTRIMIGHASLDSYWPDSFTK